MPTERPAGFLLIIPNSPFPTAMLRWLEERGLAAMSASADLSEWFIHPDWRTAKATATEEDREAVTAWLAARDDVDSFKVGPLRHTPPPVASLAFVR